MKIKVEFSDLYQMQKSYENLEKLKEDTEANQSSVISRFLKYMAKYSDNETLKAYLLFCMEDTSVKELKRMYKTCHNDLFIDGLYIDDYKLEWEMKK